MAKNFGKVNVSITASTGGLTAGLSSARKQLGAFGNSVSGSSASLNSLNSAADEAGIFFSDVSGLFGSFAAALLGVSRSAGVATMGIRVLTLAVRSLLLPLGIVAAITAPFRAFSNASSELDDASKSASRLGMSMTTFQNLSQVADEAGVSVGQMSALFTRLGIQTTALGRGNKSAAEAFGRLGVTFDQLAALSPAGQFELISRRIMALPTAAERTAAAVAIFGKSGATAMGLISAASGGAFSEVEKLRASLGVNLTDAQAVGIEMMNDAVGRMSLVFGGFINQFVAGLAPAITTVARMFVQFFAESTSGFSIAQTMAYGLVQALRMVVGAVTLLTGIFQLFQALGSQIGQMFSEVFAVILSGVTRVMRSMAELAEAAGFDGLSASLAEGARGAGQLARGARQMGEMYGAAAADTFNRAVENMANPFGAFDREFARAQQEAAAGAAERVANASVTAGETIKNAIAASTQELKAIVLGTSGGESFRNSILRGADPRLSGADAAKETADNTEEMVDQLDELPDRLAQAMGGGIGLATITA